MRFAGIFNLKSVFAILVISILSTIGWLRHVKSVDLRELRLFRQSADKQHAVLVTTYFKEQKELLHTAHERVRTKYAELRKEVEDETQPSSLWYTDDGRLNDYGAQMLRLGLMSGFNSVALEMDCDDAIDRRYGVEGLADLTAKMFGKPSDERLLMAGRCADVAIADAKTIVAEKHKAPTVNLPGLHAARVPQ